MKRPTSIVGLLLRPQTAIPLCVLVASIATAAAIILAIWS
jgi:hypothetical protein